MSRNPKMVICRKCNSPMSEKAKVCPSCGTKNKKPFYKKGWFIFLVIIAILGIIYSMGENENNIDWSETEAEYTSQNRPTEQTADKLTSEITELEESEHKDNNTSLRSDFKAAMDSYEEFMDEYVEFMKKYSNNPGDISLLADYAKFMGEYVEFVEDFEKWEDADLNTEETKYYIEVQSRVTQKLLEIAG